VHPLRSSEKSKRLNSFHGGDEETQVSKGAVRGKFIDVELGAASRPACLQNFRVVA
jgi:hypothetical protein